MAPFCCLHLHLIHGGDGREWCEARRDDSCSDNRSRLSDGIGILLRRQPSSGEERPSHKSMLAFGLHKVKVEQGRPTHFTC